MSPGADMSEASKQGCDPNFAAEACGSPRVGEGARAHPRVRIPGGGGDLESPTALPYAPATPLPPRRRRSGATGKIRRPCCLEEWCAPEKAHELVKFMLMKDPRTHDHPLPCR